MIKTLVFASLLVPTVALAQDPGQVLRLFEAGQYQQVIDAAGEQAPQAVLYAAAHSHQRLDAIGLARQTYGRLAARGEGDVWRFVGVSGQQLIDGQTDAALESARRAVAMAGGLTEAHYQLGLVLAKREDWRNAAAAFDRAAEISPSHAYAHYYGGLMHYRANRLDRMATHFEQFLKLAPEAPERPEVVQIMRTVRGR